MESCQDEVDTSPKVGSGRSGWCWITSTSNASQWAAITSIAEKIGCAGETLRHLVRPADRYDGLQAQHYRMSGCWAWDSLKLFSLSPR